MGNFGNWGGVPRYISAKEAAAKLGVSRRTLYVYVSRRLVRSRPQGKPHCKAYLESDIQRLMTRKRAGRKPSIAARDALDWGFPVLELAVTLIDRSRIWYRGRDVTELARTSSVEDTARVLWQCGDYDPFARRHVVTIRPKTDSRSDGIARCLDALSQAACRAEPAVADDPRRLWNEAADLLRLVYAAAADVPVSDRPLDRVLAAGLDRTGETKLLRRALILCADHELTTAAFAVRCAASTEASLAAALLTGLAAFFGPAQGGAPEEVEKLIDECEQAGSAEKAVALRLSCGAPFPGFGHKLHPLGDPRAGCMLEDVTVPGGCARLAAAVRDATSLLPNNAFGLVALRRSLKLPRSAGFVIYACSRALGWAAHAIEQRLSGELIRPRAAYTGPAPAV